jgi:CO/xanthine dehydrogenase Mo-binding subunit
MPSIGTSVPRRDGLGKVTGATRYAADLSLPGTLDAGILRSPYAHARITRVHTTAARAVVGVRAVLTGQQIGERLAGRSLADAPVLCTDVVRFVGDRVAAVAAETREAVEEALALIEVEYEELSAVFSSAEAMRDDAPVLHPRFLEYVGAPKEPLPLRNLCAYTCLSKGDVNRAAEKVLEHRFTTPMQHQGYLEPHACTVSIDADGVVHVWASNKAPFLVRNELARILQVPPESIIVEPTFVGGDFGGKGSAMDIPLAALLARASGRPVRLVLSGSDEFTAANPRHASEITIRSGLDATGAIVSRDIRLLFDGGAYAGYKPIPGVNLAANFWSAGPYVIPNVRFESMVAYTNHVPAGHMRAPGIAQLVFAEEVDTDLLAHSVGQDPLQFRIRHALRDGDTGPLGEEWSSVRLAECLERVRRDSGWDSPRPPDTGRGVAVSHCAGGMGASSAVVEIGADGRVVLRTGVNDQGAGSHTVLVQIVADELGLPVEQVDLVVGGTDEAPFDSGSSASRVTYVGGLAAQRAAADARERLRELAAEFLGCGGESLSVHDGVFASEDASISWQEIVKRAGPIVGNGVFQDFKLADTPSFAAVVVEVHVDRDTGQVSIRNVTCAYDVGTVLNPIGMRGQLDGGLVQGLGFALMEDLRLGDSGRVATVNLGEYKLPTIGDIPTVSSALITEAHGSGPFGAKSVGELTTPLLPAAISNAVFDAVGVRIVDLPITAEKVFSALP